ncbi:helicase [Prochlorococcus marinus]|uniref:helicase n=1 Tax=Prochlorococcus marinus TaxID=1219 RepID=UPI0022B2CD5A|nr:helicase [Prochlorococcus marinus]
MIEAYAHNFIKKLLKKDSLVWPHNLTLSRLVARSLRRRDRSIFKLKVNHHDDYWLGLLIPLCWYSSDVVLLLTAKQKQRLFQVEIPRLKDEGVNLSIWEGNTPPLDGQVWLVDHKELLTAHRKKYLKGKQLIIPEAELLSKRLREAMAMQISSANWDTLRRAYPSISLALIDLHERLTRKLFAQSVRLDGVVRLDLQDVFVLNDLCGLMGQPPSPWSTVFDAIGQGWASWTELNHKVLDWTWHLQPLEPLQILNQLFVDSSFIILSDSLSNEFEFLSEIINVNVQLGAQIHQEPLKLFAPLRQPLPNAECFAEHVLVQSRRLILGRQGLTIIILDDDQLLRKLTAELAAEFGKRVIYQSTAPDSNGVICCSSYWWLTSQDQLPSPEQLVVVILPISSLESPLTSARVEAFKKQGLDWFRDLLLPDLLTLLPKLVLPVRKNHGRIAILDGRLRARVWGEKVLDALEPWIPVDRLLPD